ncbi:MAG: P-II family nitrogen regulator [Desulfosporosinus sp.]|nr:P-II family nitrogen regulator [Desulfosporosinus sp.]
MKEIMAVIRMNMISKTKEALLDAGFPSISCRKVTGRGKKKVDFSLVEDLLSGGNESMSSTVAESISEGHRLIPKRLITIVAKDDDIKKIVEIIIAVNQKGNPGDGKIFVMPVSDSIRVRTGETGEIAI